MRRTRSSRSKTQTPQEAEEVLSKTAWQWEGDEGRWEPYSPADCVLLDSAVSSGNTSVTLSLGSGTSYEVDLKKMVQAYVYSSGNDVYDVMLNQTNLQFNNNKYYLIQLLEDDSSKVYSVWSRWGRGIYFADMSSKSANYCFAGQNNNVGLLLLSEVALGDSNELLDADYEAHKLPAGKHSTKGLGRTGPNPKNSVDLDGVTVPMGPAVKTGVGKQSSYSLLYNEFIVYNPAQTRMRYLLRIKFNYSSLW
ncbi:Poly [ADP-ribose] polymerase 2 [Liparis tanakae]|uniref:Poly [ADP-ribose] polymerase n=1 Tax=Liparis tanakae TaxID=230148 RepID=A0A4Z2GMP1_9TELE|nr:Poly [ADP-ribose] polymerase 2 [Liparis tanakae]